MMIRDEKARAYDKVVNKLKEFLAQGADSLITRANVQDFFPELSISDDELIRKEIIEFLQLPHRQFVGNRKQEKWIAWLEKQGEQNSADSYCQENCKGFQETGKCFADGECKAKRDAEQNSAWSEEDEKIMKQIDSLLYCQCTIHSSMYEKLHNWLKSLEPQPQWKPSDKQMHAFEQVYDWYNNNFATSETLTSLYQDLKKLKG